MNEYENDYAVELDDRTYGKGILGAFLGMLVGAIVWAVVLKLGYVLGLLGLGIGFVACKGYDLLKGKQGKGKIVILFLAVIVAVVLGTAGGLTWSIMETMQTDGVPMEYFEEYVQILFSNENLVAAVVSDTLQGIVFAIAGALGLIISENKKLSAKKTEE